MMSSIRSPLRHSYSQLGPAFSQSVQPCVLKRPRLVIRNAALSSLIGFESVSDQQLTLWNGGYRWPESFEPVAMVYSGHQFGHYTPCLGDGRGLLLTEIQRDQQLWDLYLKGSGPTPYSRGGDGRAVLRSCIREFLGSEALHALGVPSTRALSVVVGDESVQRESSESAAMLLRVAQSHIRFGHFEYFFYQRDFKSLQVLAHYVMQRHYRDCLHEANPYLSLFEQVVQRTAVMVAHWQAVGFTHGVMNTDNMSILGDTFDFGPFGFLDDYNPDFIANASDTSGRYAFKQQPSIAHWNCMALAHTFSRWARKAELQGVLDQFMPTYEQAWLAQMRAKLGWYESHLHDVTLINELLTLMASSRADYHRVFADMTQAQQASDQPTQTLALFSQFRDAQAIARWWQRYLRRCQLERRSPASLMAQVNPLYIPRNYLAQQAIVAADGGDYQFLERLYQAISQPFYEQPQYADLLQPPPHWGKQLRISCSS